MSEQIEKLKQTTDDEIFEDAIDVDIIEIGVSNHIIYKNYLDFEFENLVAPNLEESLKQCTEAFQLMSQNQYNNAIKICDKWAKKSLYHLHTKSLIQFIKAILTLERPEIEKATETCNKTQEMCSKVRKTSTFNTLSKFVCRPNYDDYSEDEVHAELIYAEQLLMLALMTFFGEQSIVSLVKGAFRIRSCNMSYKECMTILETRTKWQSINTKMHFESGTCLGIGALNLVLSHLPQRVLKLLEFMGFSGSSSIGFEQLNKTADNMNGLRHFLAELLIIAYESYMEQIFGLGKGNLSRVKLIVDRELKMFDKSAWFLWFKGKILQLSGNTDRAILVFNQCLIVQNELKQLHNICYWELLWSHAIKCEWDSAAKYASILRQQCNWSPATFAYQEATFLYMKMIEENRPDMKTHVSNLFRLVPTLKIRYAGKTIPPEKYCCVNAEKYFAQNEKLLLPAFELFYIWNIFALISDNLNLIKPMIKRIDKLMDQMKVNDQTNGDNNDIESYSMLLFLKGICLKEMRQYSEAEIYFLEILKNEKHITNDTFLPPEASLELGLTKLGLDLPKEAKYWLEKALKDYTGYQLETIIHFRVHCALQLIKDNKKLVKENKKSTNSLNKDSVNKLIDETKYPKNIWFW